MRESATASEIKRRRSEKNKTKQKQRDISNWNTVLEWILNVTEKKSKSNNFKTLVRFLTLGNRWPPPS